MILYEVYIPSELGLNIPDISVLAQADPTPGNKYREQSPGFDLTHHVLRE